MKFLTIAVFIRLVPFNDKRCYPIFLERYMKKLLFSFCALVFFTFPTFAQTPTPTVSPIPTEESDIVKITTSLIQIDVTVTDRNGKIITDLKPEDFEVYENKQKQEITNFSFISAVPVAPAEATAKPAKRDPAAVPIPPVAIKSDQVRRTISLVVDDLGLSFESMHFVKRSLKKFVDEQMQPNDLVAVIRTGSGAGALQQFTSDKRQLYAAIDAIKWNAIGRSGISAFSPIQPTPLEEMQKNDSNITDEDVEDDRQRTKLFNDFREDIFSVGTLGAINFVVKGMNELPGRKSIMLFSDGFAICNANNPDRCNRMLDSIRQLTDLCNRAAVTIYSIDARGLQYTGITAADSVGGDPKAIQNALSSRSAELFDKQEGLSYLANETGGRAFFNNNDFNKSLDKALEDQKGFYLIAYQPDEETFDAKTRRFNKLEVKVKRDGTNVRYRSGFFGVEDKEIAPSKLTPQQKVITALTSPFAATDINLKLNTLFGKNQANESFVQSFLHVDAKSLIFQDEPDGWKKAVFDVLAVNFGANGIPVEQISKTYTLRAKADTYQKFIENGFVYQFLFPVKKAGAYQMRVAIRDTTSSKVGSASQFIEVPDLKKKKLTLSGILLESLTPQQWDNMMKGTIEKPSDPFTDTSLRQFKKGTILRYGASIYNAKLDASQKPNLLTQTKVFRDGKPILETQPTPLNLSQQKDLTSINFNSAITLNSNIKEGDYVLQIIVTDSLAKEKSRLATQWVQFEVVP